MFPVASGLPLWLYGAGWFGWLTVLAWAVRRVHWATLPTRPEVAVAPAAWVVLSVLWQWQVGAQDGLVMHYLGATPLSLMLGAPLALVVLAAVVVVSVLLGTTEWLAAGLVGLVLTAWPVWLSDRLRRTVAHRLPRHIFVFLMGTAFFGAWIVVSATGIAVTALDEFAPIYGNVALWADYFPYFLLLGFSEAWISGMFLTLMVIYRPRWVVAFDDKCYLTSR